MECAMKDQRRKKFNSAEKNLKEWAEFAQLVIEERTFQQE